MARSGLQPRVQCLAGDQFHAHEPDLVLTIQIEHPRNACVCEALHLPEFALQSGQRVAVGLMIIHDFAARAAHAGLVLDRVIFGNLNEFSVSQAVDPGVADVGNLQDATADAAKRQRRADAHRGADAFAEIEDAFVGVMDDDGQIGLLTLGQRVNRAADVLDRLLGGLGAAG